MSSQTIDTAIAKRMVKENAIQGASIIGQTGGWSVMIKLGISERLLGTQRSDKPRVWRSLDSCVSYLKGELHISRFDMLDATNYNKIAIKGTLRSDTSERMKEAHKAAAYNKWFREGVQASMDDPRPSISNDEAKAKSRAAIRAVIEARK
ncbi:MAG: hypothetical protein CTY12_01105 [Methylotenera sp.]|nr:MAG: hypothetical protein CTY12_01105 [Methylotenera sp.]